MYKNNLKVMNLMEKELITAIKSKERRLRSCKAIANGPVGQVLAGPLFLKVKTKFHFTKSK